MTDLKTELVCSECQTRIPSADKAMEWKNDEKVRVCSTCLTRLSQGKKWEGKAIQKHGEDYCARCGKDADYNNTFEWARQVKHMVCESCHKKFEHAKKWNRQFYVKFVKKMATQFTQSAQYRNYGHIRISEEGISLYGKRVLSVEARVGVAVLMLMCSSGSTIRAGGSRLGMAIELIVYFIIGYCGATYFCLKQADMFIPFSSIIKFGCDTERQLVGIGYRGKFSPVFFQTEDWEALFQLLEEKLPGLNPSGN